MVFKVSGGYFPGTAPIWWSLLPWHNGCSLNGCSLNAGCNVFLLLHLQYGSVAAKGTTQAGFPTITSNVTLRLRYCVSMLVLLHLLYGSVAAKGTTHGFPSIITRQRDQSLPPVRMRIGFFFLAVAPMILAEGNSKE